MLLKFAYQDFLEDRKFKNTTERNIQNYKQMLGEFITYCTDTELINVEDISYTHVKEFLFMCQERGNKASTINSKLQRIRAFFNYMIECEVITKSPASKVKLQRDDTKIEVFTDAHIKQMLNFYRRIKGREKAFFAYRDYMIIVLILGTGIRRGELINLKWSDIDFINDSMTVFGKSRRKEDVPLTEKLKKELASYQVYNRQKWGDKLSEYVFVKRDNTQLTDNAITMIFRYLRERMNFKDVHLTCHVFRHTFCHRLAISGMTPFAIQKLMRHTNITVTMRYVAMWGSELREQNNKHNPLNNIEF